MRRRSISTAALVFVLLATTVPSAAPNTPQIPISREVAKQSIERSFAALDPLSARALEQAEALGMTDIHASQSVHDLNLDGVADVLVYHWELIDDPVGVTFLWSGTLTFTVLSGRSGKVLWTREWSFVDGWAGVGAFRFGSEGENGLAAIVTTFTSEAYTISVEALDGAGQEQWSRLFPSTFNWITGWGFFLPASVATDELVTFDRFDGAPGPATDLLVARADHFRRGSTALIRTRIDVLDGTDGTFRPSHGETISTRRIPSVAHQDDLDGDGLDDYAIVTKDEDGKWYVSARSGRNGKEIWTRTPRLGAGAWPGHFADLNGDGIKELVIGFDRGDGSFAALLDGRSGRSIGEIGGFFSYPLGDINGDGNVDVGAFNRYRKREVSGYRYLAYEANGRQLYNKVHAAELEGCDNGCFSAGFLIDAGDVDNDGVKDRFTDVYVFGGSGKIKSSERSLRFTTTGRSGERIAGRHLVPLRGSVDGSGNDSARLGRQGKWVTVSVHAGVTPKVLWSARLRIGGRSRLAGTFDPYDSVSRLNRDGCGDVILTVRAGTNMGLVALDGGSGRVLWTRKLSGEVRPRVKVATGSGCAR